METVYRRFQSTDEIHRSESVRISFHICFGGFHIYFGESSPKTSKLQLKAIFEVLPIGSRTFDQKPLYGTLGIIYRIVPFRSNSFHSLGPRDSIPICCTRSFCQIWIFFLGKFFLEVRLKNRYLFQIYL